MLKRLLLLLTFGVSLHAQCVLQFTLPLSASRSPVFDNRSTQCMSWSVTFSQGGRPAVVTLQSAPAPTGPWTKFAGTLALSDSSGVIIGVGAPAYLSVIRSPAGNGTLTGTLLGVVSTGGVGGDGGDVTVNGKPGPTITLTSSDIPEGSNLYYTSLRAQTLIDSALGAWAGSGNITVIGTLASGSVPWARLTNVPGTFPPSSHTHLPSETGLSNVENVALSTWSGSTSITTIGTLSAGTVPWARLGDVPSSFTPSAHTQLAASITDFSTAADARITAQKGVNSGLATLDSGGLVPVAQIPALNYQATLGFTPENAANKGIADGYASLGSDGKVPTEQLPNSGGGLTALVQDLYPTLGGNLALNSKRLIGHLTFETDNANDIGANGANRPRNGYFAGTITAPTFVGALTGNASTASNAATVTNGVYTNGSYTDPAWLTLTSSKVGLGSVENTALSTWAGSANLHTLGTLSGNLTFTSDGAYDFGAAAANRPRHIYATGNGVFGGSVTAPQFIVSPGPGGGEFIRIRPADDLDPGNMAIILGNAAWNAWPFYVTKAGNLTATSFNGSGAGLTSIPVSALVAGDYSTKITSGTYPITITGNSAYSTKTGALAGYGTTADLNTDFTGTSAHTLRWTESNGSANAPSAGWWFIENMRHSNAGGVWGRQIAWGWEDRPNQTWTRNVSGGNWGTWYQFAMADGGSYNLNATAGAGGLTVGPATGAGINQIVRTDGNGYANFGWINTFSGDAGTSAITRVYASNDAYIRYFTLANFMKQGMNAVSHDGSFAWNDQYVALPTGVVVWGVFQPQAAQGTITQVQCWSDTGDAVIQFRRNDGGDMIVGNVTCNGSVSTNINGYGVIPVGYFVGVWEVSGNAKSIRVGFKYTTAY